MSLQTRITALAQAIGADVKALLAALSGKEPTISAGTTAKYWRGDKTWRDFATDVRAAPLTGLSTSTNAAIVATDTVLVAQGKLQAQVSTKANATSVREKLTAARTYYVRTDGNDSNNGLANAAGGAFLTIQKAVDTVAALDLGIDDVTIMVGTGTWTATTTLKTLVGAGKVVIRGINANTTGTVITGTTACFKGTYVGAYEFQHMTLGANAATGVCIDISGGGAVARWGSVNFAVASEHVRTFAGAYAEAIGAYTISGGGSNHISTYETGALRVVSVTVTLLGTPSFSNAFALSSRVGSLLVFGVTFSGDAIGPRYVVSGNSVIYTGAGATYLPGNQAGTADTGGQYL